MVVAEKSERVLMPQSSHRADSVQAPGQVTRPSARHTLWPCRTHPPCRSTSTCSSSEPASRVSTRGVGSRCTAQAPPGPSSRRANAIGGTWDLFRYPGIRSDSDMYTLGFPFRPWRGDAAMAAGAEIRDYVQETARELGVTERLHLGQRVERLEWSSSDARWSVTARTADGDGDPHGPVRLPRDGLLLLRGGSRRRLPGAGATSPERSCTRSTGRRGCRSRAAASSSSAAGPRP